MPSRTLSTAATLLAGLALASSGRARAADPPAKRAAAAEDASRAAPPPPPRADAPAPAPPPKAPASDAEALAEMQQKLNAQVMEKPFAVEDPAAIDAYVAEAMKKNLKPQATPPAYWQPGYTCADLLRYRNRYRSYWSDYRECMYHHRYYGRYW